MPRRPLRRQRFDHQVAAELAELRTDPRFGMHTWQKGFDFCDRLKAGELASLTTNLTKAEPST
jgi:hypothetical protein